MCEQKKNSWETIINLIIIKTHNKLIFFKKKKPAARRINLVIYIWFECGFCNAKFTASAPLSSLQCGPTLIMFVGDYWLVQRLRIDQIKPCFLSLASVSYVLGGKFCSCAWKRKERECGVLVWQQWWWQWSAWKWARVL